jgi:hypothetical protein
MAGTHNGTEQACGAISKRRFVSRIRRGIGRQAPDRAFTSRRSAESGFGLAVLVEVAIRTQQLHCRDG